MTLLLPAQKKSIGGKKGKGPATVEEKSKANAEKKSDVRLKVTGVIKKFIAQGGLPQKEFIVSESLRTKRQKADKGR